MRRQREEIPDCRECEDGSLVLKNERCPVCGCRGKKMPPEHRARKGRFEQMVSGKLRSDYFAKLVQLARKRFGIPDGGFSAENALSRLVTVYWACLSTYMQTLEPFHETVLKTQSQAEREAKLREIAGPLASLLATLSFPEKRSPYLDWMMGLKLEAARLCSWVGISDTWDMLLYIMSPELRPIRDWNVNPISAEAQDPLLEQMEHFLLANLPLNERLFEGRCLREQLEAAAYLAYYLAACKHTWDDNRKAIGMQFPALGSEYTKKHKVRAKRAAQRLKLEEELVQIVYRLMLQSHSNI